MSTGKVVFIRKNGRIIPIKINDNHKDTGKAKVAKGMDFAAGALLGASLFMKAKRFVPMIGAAGALSVGGVLMRRSEYGNNLEKRANSEYSSRIPHRNGVLAGMGAATFGAVGLYALRKKGVFLKAGEKLGQGISKASDLASKLRKVKKGADLSKYSGKTFTSTGFTKKKVAGLIGYSK